MFTVKMRENFHNEVRIDNVSDVVLGALLAYIYERSLPRDWDVLMELLYVSNQVL